MGCATSHSIITCIPNRFQGSICLSVCCFSLQVKFSVFINYVRSLTWYMAILIMFFNVLANGLSVGGNFWLAAWSDREDTRHHFSGAETYV